VSARTCGPEPKGNGKQPEKYQKLPAEPDARLSPDNGQKGEFSEKRRNQSAG